MILPAVMLAVIFLAPGYAAWLAFGGELRDRLSVVETLFLIVLAGALIVSWPAMILAAIGLFSLPLLSAIVLGSSLLVVAWVIRNGHRINPFRDQRPDLAAILAIVVLVTLFAISPRPSEYIVGGRDHGIYVNTGVHIARKGSILLRDPELVALPAESRRALISPEVTTARALVPGPWSQGRHVPGTTIRDIDRGILLPHAYHLYPVWIAIFDAIGGLPFALYTTMVFSFIGALVIYLAGVRLFGRPVALLALALLLLNVTQNWFARYPSAEIVVRFFFWSGILAAIWMFTYQSRFAAVLAGSSFGMMHLAKLDTVFVPLLLLLFFLYAWISGRFQRQYKYLLLAYSFLLVHAAVHGFFMATVYTLDQATRVLLPDFLAQRIIRAASGYTYPLDILGRLLKQNADLIIGAAALTLLLAFLTVRYRKRLSSGIDRLERSATWARGLLALTLGFFLVAAYTGPHLRPDWLEKPAQSLQLTSWYLSPLGLTLGLVGLLMMVARNPGDGQAKSQNFAWLLVVGNTLPLFVWGPGSFPDNFWVIRRFITVAYPGLILFAAYVLWQLVPLQRGEWLRGLLPLALTMILAFSFWQVTKPVSRVVEYDGLSQRMTEFDRQFPEEAVLLFDKSDAAGRISAPLWYMYDRAVFLLDKDALDIPGVEAAVERWQAMGRDVFWITDRPKLPSLNRYVLAYDHTEEFTEPLVETPIGRLPERVGEYRATLDVYRLTDKSQAEEWLQSTTVAVASGKDDIPLKEGLYDVQLLPGLSPRRWTSGRVVLEIPVRGRPKELLLSMENGRPAGMAAPVVTVSLEGRVLGKVRVGRQTSLFSFPIPGNVSFVEEMIELRLEMESWIPAETGHSPDERELGVYLNWIKLIGEQS